MTQLLRVRAGYFTALGAPNEVGDDTGFFIERAGWTGWESGTDTRGDDVARTLAPGSFDRPGFQSARVVSIGGWAQANSPEELGHMRAIVTGLGADGGLVRVTVDEHGKTMWGDFRLTGKTSFVDQGGDNTARFQIQFWSAREQLFGETRTFPSGASVYHYGNYGATPKITVTGSGAYTITSGSRQFIVSSALPAGQTDVIDFRTGWVRRNGALMFGGVSRAETWAIPPGQQVPMSITGGMSMSVAVTDTWV